jgi:hypothetical protein
MEIYSIDYTKPLVSPINCFPNMFSTNKTPNKSSHFNHFNMDMNNILNHGGFQRLSPINYEKFFRIDSFESMQDNELELREQNNNYNNHYNHFNDFNNDCKEEDEELENDEENNFNSSNFSVKKKKLSIDINIVNKSNNTNHIFKQNASNMMIDDIKSKILIF